MKNYEVALLDNGVYKEMWYGTNKRLLVQGAKRAAEGQNLVYARIEVTNSAGACIEEYEYFKARGRWYDMNKDYPNV